MQILAISGRANEGKTTTVEKLLRILFSESKQRKYSTEQLLHDDIDVIKIKDLELTVVFGKNGDTEYQVQKNCDFTTKIKADLFIQTTRTKGKGADALYRFAQNTHDIIKIGTISPYFGLPSKFFANRSAIDEINNIQAANTWKLLLHILQKNYNF